MTATAPKITSAFALPITSMLGLNGKVCPPSPLHCLDNPYDIDDAVLFLLSDAPSWVAGQANQVAGGHVL